MSKRSIENRLEKAEAKIEEQVLEIKELRLENGELKDIIGELRLSNAVAEKNYDPEAIQQGRMESIMEFDPKLILQHNSVEKYTSPEDVDYTIETLRGIKKIGDQFVDGFVINCKCYRDEQKWPRPSDKYIYVCLFEHGGCNVVTKSMEQMLTHVRSHLNAPEFFCLCCGRGFKAKDSCVNKHIKACVPFFEYCGDFLTVLSKTVSFTVVKQVAAHFFTTGAYVDQFVGSQPTVFTPPVVAFLKEYYEELFRPTPVRSINNYVDFKKNFQSLFPAQGNDELKATGVLFSIVELTDDPAQMTINDFVQGSRMACSSKYFGQDRLQHLRDIKNAKKESTSYHYKLQQAIKEEGRQFTFVTILDGMKSEVTVGKDHSIPRFDVENALKRLKDCCSLHPWNVKPIQRNENNFTFEWSPAQDLIFARELLYKCWPNIQKHLRKPDIIKL